MSENGKNYELLYLLPNQYTEDEAEGIKNKVETMLKKYGAVIGYGDFLGKKKLAYPISKAAHGYYYVVEFELPEGPKLKDISNELRLDKEILRAQIIAKHKITPAEMELAKKIKAGEEIIEAAPRAKAPAARAKEKPAAFSRKESHKVGIENLDQKLEEILKTDDLV